jgi:hypothetical protein
MGLIRAGEVLGNRNIEPLAQITKTKRTIAMRPKLTRKNRKYFGISKRMKGECKVINIPPMLLSALARRI